jgi:hypothetical protein
MLCFAQRIIKESLQPIKILLLKITQFYGISNSVELL